MVEENIGRRTLEYKFALPFGHFLDQLRHNGFAIGVEHHLRIRELLSRADGQFQPGDLKTLLCPIVASSEEQQTAFYDAFDLTYPQFCEEPIFAVPVASPPELPRAEALPKGETALPRPAKSRKEPPRPGLLFLGIGFLVVLAAALFYNAGRTARQPSQENTSTPPRIADAPPSQSSPEGAAATGDLTPSPESTWHQWVGSELRRWQMLGVGVPILAWLLLEGILRRRRRSSIQRRRGLRPPLSWPVTVANTHVATFSDPQFHTLARRMQRRQPGPNRQLDVAESIRATIRSLGYPQLVFRRGTQPPEYLILVEQTSPQDHQALLYSQMVRALEADGVHIREFHFDGDPRECWSPEGRERTSLADLHGQAGERLILIGEMECLVDGISGEIAPWAEMIVDEWKDRAILTPLPLAKWGARERVLSQVAPILPATVDGMQAAIERFLADGASLLGTDVAGRRMPEPIGSESELAVEPNVRQLRDTLSPGVFLWLCACAVYPQLNWNLTLRLATLPSLPRNLLMENNLLALVTLRWFRRGVLPDELRLALLRELSEQQQREVRQTILEVLQTGPQPPDGTHARDYQQLEIVFNRHWLERTTGTFRAFQRTLRKWPDVGDVNQTYLALTDSLQTSFLDFVLPQNILSRLRRQSLASNHLQFGLRATTAFLLAGVMVAAVNWSHGQYSTRLASGKSTPSLPLPAAPVRAAVQVRTTPSGAQVRIDNGVQCISDCTIELPPGRYRLEASLPGYAPITRVLSIASETIDLPLTFARVENTQPQAPPGIPEPGISPSGEALEPVLLQRVLPIYPDLVRRTDVQGTVLVEAKIGRDGTVQSVSLISGHPLLAPAVMQAVQKWIYRPASKDGRPIEVVKRISMSVSSSGISTTTLVVAGDPAGTAAELAQPGGLPPVSSQPPAVAGAPSETIQQRPAEPSPVSPAPPPTVAAPKPREAIRAERRDPPPAAPDIHASHRQEISALLTDYSTAWRRKDSSRIATLFPGAPVRDLRAVFDFATQVNFELTPVGAPRFADGNPLTASVICKRSTRIEYRDRRTAQAVTDTVTVTLTQTAGSWRIQSIQ